MNKKFIPFTITLFLAAVALSGCSSSRILVRSTSVGEYFNGYTDVAAYTSAEQESAVKSNVDSCLSRIHDLENNISAEGEGDIFRFNQADPGEKIAVTRQTYEILTTCQRLYTLTDGAYDPAVAALVDLWSFSPRFLNGTNWQDSRPYDRTLTNIPPDEKYITAFLQLCDFSQVQLSCQGEEYYVTKPNVQVQVDGVSYSMQLDLSGFGKGYAAQTVGESLASSGVECGYVSFGGSSLYLLGYPSSDTQNKWKILLNYPRQDLWQGQWYAQLYGANCGVSTSGQYINYYTYEGVNYCHIIDPSTGRPVQNNLVTVTVVGGDAAENDCLTTALTVMGKERAIEFINTYLTDRTVVFAVEQEGGYAVYTNATEQELTIHSEVESEFTLRASGDGNGKIMVK